MVLGSKKAPGGTQMKRLLFLLIVMWSFFAAGLSSQELEPEEPDLELPPMSLELEDLLEEDVETLLPELQFSPEIELDTELPDPPEIEIPLLIADLALDLETPTEAEPGTREKSSSIYSNGTIGLGNTNRILGDLAIYKLGPEPHFQLQFIHERYDGYNFRARGSGFFHRYNLISGGLSYRPGKFLLDTGGAYREYNDGLQGLGLYDSVLHRSVGGEASFRYYISDAVTIGSDFAGLYTQETISGDAPVNGYELALSPELFSSFRIDPVLISLSGGYEFRYISGAASPLHGAAGTAGIDVTLRENWAFGGNVGVDWHTEKTIQVPFALYLRKGINEAFEITLRGGYKTELLRFGDLWIDSPFYQLSNVYPEISAWFAYLDTEWEVRPLLTLGGRVDFSLFDRAVYPSEAPDENTGMLEITGGSAYLLETEARFRWETLQWLSLWIYWDGAFLDVPDLVPSHTLGVRTELSSLNDMWRGALGIDVPVYSSPTVPILDVSLTFAPSIGIEFTLSGEDLLSPLINGTRKEWGFYETPGLNVMFAANISL